MSHQATTWALRQRGLSPVEKIVLLQLADRHNPDHGGCFPSQERLAYDCETSRATLNRVLSSLEKMKLISRTKRLNPETRRQENTYYKLHLDVLLGDEAVSQNETRQEVEPCLKSDESRVSNSTDSVSHSCETLTRKGTRKGTRNSARAIAHEQPPLLSMEADDPQMLRKSEDTIHQRFAEFWKEYPKKVGKPSAEKNFRRVVKEGADPKAIIDGARNYARRVSGDDPKFVKHPQGWLSDRRWESEAADEALTPEQIRYRQMIAWGERA